MKGKLIFNLDDQDDLMAFKRAVKSDDMANVIFQFLLNSKKGFEYEIEEKNLNGYETLDMIYDRFNKLVDDEGINIDELVR